MSRRLTRMRYRAAVLALALCTARASAATTYKITDLGALPGGTRSQAAAINAGGQVAGQSSAALNASQRPNHAFIWMDGQMLDLSVGSASTSFATGLNASGQVVGQAQVDNGAFHAVLWDVQNGNQQIDLGALDDVTNTSVAFAINAGGQVVGYSYVADGSYHAFLYAGGVMLDLGVLPNSGISSTAYAINTIGQIVGYSTTDAGSRAVLWIGGNPQDLSATCAALAGGDSIAYGINDGGQIVGVAAGHPFLLSNPTDPNGPIFVDMGTLGGSRGIAYGINGAGQVVGESYTASFVLHAFLWQNGAIADLNTLIPADSGWTLVSARSINDKGQIVGFGDCNGQRHAFLLDPIADIPPPDTSAPATTLALDGPAGKNGWYTGDVHVTLSATDPDDSAQGSDVAATYYSLDGGAKQTYSGPFAVSGDGAHAVEFWSVDKAGNEEAHQKQAIQIDGTAPTASASANPSLLSPPNGKMATVTISGTVADGASGIDPASARFAVIDSYGRIQPQGPVQVGADGKYCFSIQLEAYRNGEDKNGRLYTVQVSVCDMAGNHATACTSIAVPH